MRLQVRDLLAAVALGVDLGKLPGIPEQMANEIRRATEEEKAKNKSFEERYTGKPAREEPKPPVAPPAERIAPDLKQIYERRQRRGGALPFNEEENADRGSLSTFLRAPAGRVAPTTQNAPAASRTPTRGKSMNLSDQDIIGIGVEEVPNGADINQYLRK